MAGDADATGPKGYWLVHLTIHDAGAFMAYLRAVRAIFRDWDATYLVQAGASAQREGESIGEKYVVVQFASYEKAQACYDSPAYQDAIALRSGCATLNLSIVEGVA